MLYIAISHKKKLRNILYMDIYTLSLSHETKYLYINFLYIYIYIYKTIHIKKLRNNSCGCKL
jgi:hypothetical protein